MMQGNNYFFTIFLNLFIISCIFDPFGNILHIKDGLFIILFIIFLIFYKNIKIELNLFIYAFKFISIALISIIIYSLTNNSEPYEGLMLLRTYLLFILVVPIVYLKINLLKILIRWINALCILIFILLFVNFFSVDLFNKIAEISAIQGNMLLGIREFGGISFLQLYYVTSPLICINIAYYSDQIFSNKYIYSKNYIYLLIFNCLALFFAGTRSNILIAIFLPFSIYLYYSKNANLRLIALLLLLAILVFFSIETNFFSAAEESNSIKINLLHEYVKIFNDIPTILFGQGLGAYYYWETKNKFDFVTELTYLEIFRYYGIFFGALVINYMIVPIKKKISTLQ